MDRLGFSDLTENEALLVSIYRDWASARSARADAERAIFRNFAHDPLAGVLTTVFAAFRQVAPAHETWCGTGDLLSPQEERLLDALAQHIPGPRSQPGESEGAPTPCFVRPSAEIDRSGRDALCHRVNAASWRVALNL
ncbi:MAG: hypothetical protein AAGH83_04150 [Pseudomonadota bacterium]